MATIDEALTAYKICARAESRSPKTIRWILQGVGYFAEFLGPERQDIETITSQDLRAFIIHLQDKPKFSDHPFTKPQDKKLKPISIETYARAIRAFFGFLYREEIIDHNPMSKVRMPKVPKVAVPTFSQKQVEALLSNPNKKSHTGFRDYALMLTYIDTTARLAEIALLEEDDIDLENGYLRVVGKGAKERFVPFGHKVARALLKYKLKHRPTPIGTKQFWLTYDGRPLKSDRINRIFAYHGEKAGLGRWYPHKLRHTSSVLYLRNGGDLFSLQKKLGHTSLQMTRHYANLADSDVKNKHMQFGVGDRLKA